MLVLGQMKQNVLESLKRCKEQQLFSDEYLQAKIVLLPLSYEDVTQEDIQPLLDMFMTEEPEQQEVVAE